MDALILVDLQNDYFPGGRMELDGVEAAVANGILSGQGAPARDQQKQAAKPPSA